MSLGTAATSLLTLAIAWGAFAFGAVYPWAYWPMVVAAQVAALMGLFARTPNGGKPLGLAPLAVGLSVFLMAGVLQLIPLPDYVVRAVSPEAPTVVTQLDLGARLGASSSHPLSIAPSATAIGLAVIGSLAVLVLGASRLFSLTGPFGIARAITVVGVCLALAGIVQQPLFAGKIYGFWSPLQGGNPYGPFVNKNHFAGWMLMGLSVTLGLLSSGISRGMRGVRPGLREKVLWLSSPDASGLLLLSGAAGVMALSLILTMSRSGMSAATLAVLIAAGLAMRRYRTKSQSIAAVAVICLLSLLVIGWAGTDVIATRFSNASIEDLNGRLGPWKDAIRIIRMYPLAGTGLNTYGVATLFYQQFNLSVHYAQAHNDYLQLAAEGGLLLTVPAALCIALLVAGIRRRFREETSVTTYWIRAGATIGLVAMALQETVEFSLQMPGNALLFAVLCAIALHRTPERRPDGRAAERIAQAVS